jgi:hypothetical protein
MLEHPALAKKHDDNRACAIIRKCLAPSEREKNKQKYTVLITTGYERPSLSCKPPRSQ